MAGRTHRAAETKRRSGDIRIATAAVLATAITTTGSAVALPVSGQTPHPLPLRHHYPRHRECQTRRCAHNADRAWARLHRRKRVRIDVSGWAIPEAIVMCESKGTNEPPNEATASGYYQITDETWPEGGGSKPNEAWRHSKAEQDRVAARLWAGGAGAGRWKECLR